MRVSALLVWCCFVAAANGETVARAGSTSVFRMRGVDLAPIGAPSWPVMAGDEIEAGPAPVTVMFGDGSRVVLGARSSARVKVEGGVAVLELKDAGSAYWLKPGGAVKVWAGGQQVEAAALVQGKGGGGMGIINKGKNPMPAFADVLSAEEKNDLMAYLKTL